MPNIKIVDLEVQYCVGVTDAERAEPQRLLICVDMIHDFSVAAVCDRIEKTIDYHAVSQHILAFGHNRSWKLIEKVAANIADLVLIEFEPESVTVEVKKFVITQAAYVSVTWTQYRGR